VTIFWLLAGFVSKGRVELSEEMTTPMNSPPTLADMAALLASLKPHEEIQCLPQGWRIQKRVLVQSSEVSAILRALKPFAVQLLRGAVTLTAVRKAPSSALVIHVDEVELSEWPAARLRIQKGTNP
jgi:hypothetical protein